MYLFCKIFRIKETVDVIRKNLGYSWTQMLLSEKYFSSVIKRGSCYRQLNSFVTNDVFRFRSVFKQTIITEWELVCDRKHLASLAQTVTMLGILFGNMIFGYLSDK